MAYAYAAPSAPSLNHAGEDYHAGPGTPVATIADGRIVYVGADPNQPQRWDYDQRGYGNIVIIDHQRSDGSRYHSIYGHLSPNGRHDYGNVVAGETIGFVGHDKHNGAGGPHLHLQIHDGAYVDSSYNRIGGWLGENYAGWKTKLRPSSVVASWNFDRGVSGWDYGRHGWTTRNAVNVDSASTTNWTINPNFRDPGIQSENLRLDRRHFNAVRVRLQSDMPDASAQLYFTTRNDPTWTESKSLTLNIPTGRFNEVTFDMRALPSWVKGGEITGLRFDPGRFGRSDNADLVKIDWIRAFGLVSLRSMNYPDHVIRHRNSQAFIDRNDGSQLFRLDSSFVARPGLADPGAVSYESLNYPGYYLRHFNYRLILSRDNGTKLLRGDATFIPRSGLGDASGVSYESFNYRGHYLRHRNFQVWLDPLQSHSLYRQDATFFIF